jgi:hypothetical protein
MKSDPELDALVHALRDDLPNDRDSARLRARLSALGLAASHALVSTSAAAAGAAPPAVAEGAVALGAAGKAATQAGALALALKAGAVVVVSATVMAGPLWIAQRRSLSVAPAASGADGAQRAPLAKRSLTTAPRGAVASVELTNPSELFAGEAARMPANEREAAATAVTPSGPRGLAQATPGSAVANAADSAASRGSSATRASASEETPSRAAAPNSAIPSTKASAQSTAGFARDDEPAAPPRAGIANEPTTLREETALIDGALAALRSGDRARAATLLGEHQRRFPQGLLARERERALRTMDELKSQRSAP